MEARVRESALKERELAEAKEAREREIAEAKEARERETVLKERKMAEAKEAHERELQKLQIQRSIEEKKHVFEMERLAAEQNEKPEEGFKRRFKRCRPDSSEFFQQFTSRLKSYLTRWIDMSGINKTFEGLADLILRDQLAFICNRDLELFLRERDPSHLNKLVS